MTTQKTKFAVGLFVGIGVLLSFAAIIWLGMTKVFEKGQYYVTYFDESVQGLSKDAQVKYRGVPVGRVIAIEVAPDNKLVEVILKIEIEQEINNDVVAQLKPVGITGSIYLELDRKDPKSIDPTPVITFPTPYPVIASKPSTTKQIFHGIDMALAKLNKAIDDINFPALSKEVQRALKGIADVSDNPKIPALVTSLQRSSQRFQEFLDNADRTFIKAEKTVGRVDLILDQNTDLIHQTITELNSATQNANQLIDHSGKKIDKLEVHLLATVKHLEQASANVNRLVETLEDHPAQLLFGESPTPKPIESDEPGKTP